MLLRVIETYHLPHQAVNSTGLIPPDRSEAEPHLHHFSMWTSLVDRCRATLRLHRWRWSDRTREMRETRIETDHIVMMQQLRLRLADLVTPQTRFSDERRPTQVTHNTLRSRARILEIANEKSGSEPVKELGMARLEIMILVARPLDCQIDNHIRFKIYVDNLRPGCLQITGASIPKLARGLTLITVRMVADSIRPARNLVNGDTTEGMMNQPN